jgi:hypothetical protein
MLSRAQLQSWGVDELLQIHSGLTVEPSTKPGLLLAGTLRFSASAAGLEEIADDYQVEILVPPSFPRSAPRVRELGGRVPKDFHKLEDGSLCLGSPLSLRLAMAAAPTLCAFVQTCIIPYLYGYSFYKRHGRLPFGELSHGDKGLIEDYKHRFGVTSASACVQMLLLLGMKKRVANKRPCPCASGQRLGRCHHLLANRLRIKLGREWCRAEAAWLVREYLKGQAQAEMFQAVQQTLHAADLAATSSERRERSTKKVHSHETLPSPPDQRDLAA